MRRQFSPWAAFSIVLFLSVGMLALTIAQGKAQNFPFGPSAVTGKPYLAVLEAGDTHIIPDGTSLETLQSRLYRVYRNSAGKKAYRGS
jgi:hypothetical protein